MPQLLEFFHNHTLLFAAAGVVLVLLIVNEMTATMLGEVRINAPDAVRLINDRDAVIVDLRPAAEFKRGHLLNAINLPFAKIEERASEIGKDKARPVLLYCALGSMASQAAAKLKKQGFTEVYPLKGGLNAWTGANLPVTAK
ncbi:MAG TPA: rhodanese-like domain-containing protein [Nevskiaceae bacterium]|nr:rhodanese-like domain-containing protein [Nevskiaceae bacterium]